MFAHPRLMNISAFDLDREGQNNNSTVRSLKLDGYCFNHFHNHPPDYPLTAGNPFTVSVWRVLTGYPAMLTGSHTGPHSVTSRTGFYCQGSHY